MRYVKWMRHGEKGLTLIELLVAIPIIGVLGLSMSALLVQLLRADDIGERVVAVRQVQSAAEKVSTDAMQAQQVTFGDDMTADNWSLVLAWTGQWTDNDATYNSREITVTYTLTDDDNDGLYDLERRETGTIIIGATTEARDRTNVVGDHLDRDQMSCEWQDSSENSFAFKVVATVGTKTEERTYNIAPRALG